MDSAVPPCESYLCLISYWYGSVHEAGAPVDLQARVDCPGCDPVLMGNVELLGDWADYGQAQTLAQCSVVTSPDKRIMLINKLRSTKYVNKRWYCNEWEIHEINTAKYSQSAFLRPGV